MSSTPTNEHPPPSGRTPDGGDQAWAYFLSTYYPSRRQRRRDAVRTVLRTVVGMVAFAVAVALILRYGIPAFYGARLWLLEETTLTPAEVRQNVDFLRETLYHRHPRPFQFTDREELDRLFEAVAAVSGPVSKRDFYRRAAPVVAAVRCGHTVLVPGPSYVSSLLGGGRVLPFRAVVLGERLFVSQVYSDQAAPLLGAEIVAINGVDAREIKATLVASQSRDGLNPAFAVYKVNDLFPFLYYVHVDNSGSFQIRVRPPGEPQAIVEHRVVAEPARRVVDEYRRQNPGRNYFETRRRLETIVLARQRAAYLGIPSFQLPPSRYGDIFETFFSDLEREGVESLVIDLRGNTGGGPHMAVELLRYLLPRPFRYLDASDDAVDMFTDIGYETYYQPITPHPKLGYRGDLYVLLDGGSFSQTGQVASMLAAAGNATFVGEESGGSFSCNDNSTLVELPHGGFRLKVARTAFETSARDLPRGRGILPDVPIRPTVDHLIAGRDPVLEWIDLRLGTDTVALVANENRGSSLRNPAAGLKPVGSR